MEERKMNYEEACKYLHNFWEPVLGSTVVKDDAPFKIVEIVPGYPEQAILEPFNNKARKRVGFLQDYTWKPQEPELMAILIGLGATFYEDGSLRIKDTWFKKPMTVEEYAGCVVDARCLTFMKGSI